MALLIIISVVFIIIFYLKRQSAMAEEQKLRISARIRGIDECEVSSPFLKFYNFKKLVCSFSKYTESVLTK